MNYLGKAFSGLKDFYNDLNPSTLSGALDIIVVHHEDGSLTCSPFHVRFGKLQILRSKEKLVQIEVNGEKVDLIMKLGDAGEAFFVVEGDRLQDIPSHLLTSPIPTAAQADDTEIEPLMLDADPLATSGMSSDATSLAVHPTSSTTTTTTTAPIAIPERQHPANEHSLHFDLAEPLPHDSSAPPAILSTSLPSESGYMLHEPALDFGSAGPASDSEMDDSSDPTKSQQKKAGRTWSWGWGDLPQRSLSRLFGRRNQPPVSPDADKVVSDMEQGGIRLADLVDDDNATPPISHSPSEQQTIVQHMLNQQRLQQQRAQLQQHSREGSPRSSGASTPIDLSRSLDSSKGLSVVTSTSSLSRSASQVTAPEFPSIVLAASLADLAHPSSINLPVSPVSAADDDDDFIQMSLCGANPDFVAALKAHNQASEGRTSQQFAQLPSYVPLLQLFRKDLVTFEAFAANPLEVLRDERAVFRINGGFYNFVTAAPMILSVALYQQPLPLGIVHELQRVSLSDSLTAPASVTHAQPTAPPSSAPSKLAPNPSTSSSSSAPSSTPGSAPASATVSRQSSRRGWLRNFWSGDEALNVDSPPSQATNRLSDSDLFPATASTLGAIPVEPSIVHTPPPGASVRQPPANPNIDHVEELKNLVNGEPAAKIQAERYQKSLRLSSEQLAKLNLRPGANTIKFSVTTKLQGTATCTSSIFLWRYDCKIVISDVDGTITKSDVMGHILPALGRDWTHSGVASLYSALKSNGYEILYLSSRAIGQANITRGFLQGVKQGQLTLPHGPVLLSPDRLLTSFHREVIKRKPEEFKIACLKDIRSLFGLQDEPFYAGFGNRHTDSLSYRAVGVPEGRIFTINPAGELRLDLMSSFLSSYTKLSDLVDHMFPPINGKAAYAKVDVVDRFNNFNYWRPPLPVLDIANDPMLSPKIPSSPKGVSSPKLAPLSTPASAPAAVFTDKH
ncbi:nuclear elongation and deformation protein 1 [Capsaspora owczarzaki ATCC 30864]|uniref:phosphatidate phosphatase n=1 Tax=Capsaspora owczarzaki (strain ATCC 30864) TaxID=595528 RepID=A0A0D2VIN0_CAPO3|nr:nuclear elongation and deformation protein 1 [Capsaspora owczarzaki ATCC 30864]KJE89847.1 nuclear elongation and deformation protein 1 [Capsaspora owczarzaki ATCC 30864]|eukprot:XP_004349790.1 nuclear elongation and deformation protein 1 [Capsaspora owczarzaki ATCC 30864]